MNISGIIRSSETVPMLRQSVLVGGVALIISGCASVTFPAWTLDTVRVAHNVHGGLIVRLACTSELSLGIIPRHLAEQLSLPTQYHSELVDLAVLQEHSLGSALTLASSLPALGELVWMVHSPNGLPRLVAAGVVAGYRVDGLYMVLYAGTYLGSSGGAVISQRGELVGVVIGMRADMQLGFPTLVPMVTWVLPADVIRAELKQAVPGCLEE